MLSTITLIGRITKDPELMTGRNGSTFTCLDLAVNKGFGERTHANYYKGYLNGEAADRVIRAGVRKGSLLYVTGDLEIRPYVKKDGSNGTSCEISVHEWDYVQTGHAKTETGPDSAPETPESRAGAEEEPLPPCTEIGEDGELPF